MCGEMSTWQKIRQGYIFACIFSILLVKVIWKLNHDVSNFLSYCLLAAFFCFVSFAFVRYSFWFERLMPEERWFCTNKKYLILQCVIKSKVKGEKNESCVECSLGDVQSEYLNQKFDFLEAALRMRNIIRQTSNLKYKEKVNFD